MITHRPLLTVAVCVSTSSARPEAQSRLLRAFRHAVSSKIFLTSEKSLDILLGLLVHIAWSHHSLSHVQLYQHLHLIAAMAADQGLYVPTSSADETPNALERNRALIGSYYLCAHLPEFGLERPNPMRWNDNLFQCARSVARMGHLPSDAMMSHILELSRTVDVFNEGFRSSANHRDSTSDYSIDLHLRLVDDRFDSIRRECPAIDKFPGFRSAKLQVYHRIIRGSSIPEPRVLIQSACLAKDYFDMIHSQPASTLHQIAITDWTGLLSGLVLIAKIAHLPPIVSREGPETEALVQPDSTMHAICTAFASAPIDDPLSPRNEALLKAFYKFCEGIRKNILCNEPRTASMIPGLNFEGNSSRISRTHNQPFFEHAQIISGTSQRAGRGPKPVWDLRSGILDEDLWRALR
jgi:hypothetical protein